MVETSDVGSFLLAFMPAVDNPDRWRLSEHRGLVAEGVWFEQDNGHKCKFFHSSTFLQRVAVSDPHAYLNIDRAFADKSQYVGRTHSIDMLAQVRL